ncbi:MAG: carbohydrate ABC transporter substrate-binding protein, partial [Oscillospiraceae bacterium]|nr:carbohydrate ABC transporter substrate-binding protein [Oscillospiraceae bacterium]
GTVYGIPTTGNVQGIVYNKKIWFDAGITELPVTPEEFIKDLTLIKEKTNAVPLYTNYAAGWTLTAWDAYINGCATGKAEFKNQILPHASNPFAEQANHTGAYEVYHILYQAVSEGLTEDDPTTTDWESCKSKINNGEISAMVLGSWAIPQMQNAGAHAEDIAYMPFPISVDGKVYASASGDYCYGINKNSSEDEKIASMLYLKYLTEQSNYAYDQGGIPIVKGEKYPATLSAFEGLSMIVDAPALEGEEDFYNIVNNDSELSLDADAVHVARIIEAAETKSETFEDIMNDWNARWTAAQKRNGIEIKK